MKSDEFDKMVAEDRYDVKKFTSFNYIIFDKETNRRFISIELSNDEVGFVEVFCNEDKGGI